MLLIWIGLLGCFGYNCLRRLIVSDLVFALFGCWLWGLIFGFVWRLVFVFIRYWIVWCVIVGGFGVFGVSGLGWLGGFVFGVWDLGFGLPCLGCSRPVWCVVGLVSLVGGLLLRIYNLSYCDFGFCLFGFVL